MFAWKSAVGCLLAVGFTTLLWGAPPAQRPGQQTLEIYSVDVEGGQATLLVTPEGGSILLDTGYPGLKSEKPNQAPDRDGMRIFRAAQDACINQIDVVLASHDHPDHMDGILGITKFLPVGLMVDHGPAGEDRETQNQAAGAYPKNWREALETSEHQVAHAGEKIDVKGLDDVTVVLSMDVAIDRRGEPNPGCADVGQAQQGRRGAVPWYTRGAEDQHGLAVAISYGKFNFAFLGDNRPSQEVKLLCPENKLGKVDVYLAAMHGATANSGDGGCGASCHNHV